MDPMWLLLYPYFLGAGMWFLCLTSSWSNPWPWDKALAFGVFWLPCVIFMLIRGLGTGLKKLFEDHVL